MTRMSNEIDYLIKKKQNKNEQKVILNKAILLFMCNAFAIYRNITHSDHHRVG